MPDLKELLGEHYTDELAAKLIVNDGTYIPKANADAESARLRHDLIAANEKAKQLEMAQLSAEEQAKLQVKEALEAANQVKADSLKMMSRLELQTGLSSTGLDMSAHNETLSMLVGDDPEAAKKISAGLQKIIAEAKNAGIAEANATHLKNNGAPGGGKNNEVTKESFKKMNIDERMKLSKDYPELYASLKGG